MQQYDCTLKLANGKVALLALGNFMPFASVEQKAIVHAGNVAREWYPQLMRAYRTTLEVTKSSPKSWNRPVSRPTFAHKERGIITATSKKRIA